MISSRVAAMLRVRCDYMKGRRAVVAEYVVGCCAPCPTPLRVCVCARAYVCGCGCQLMRGA
eukprot:scaffold11670_cov136-Isochrysis_galbana.AAC.2